MAQQKIAPTCAQLLAQFQSNSCLKTQRLNLQFPYDKDVYNITAPFSIGDKTFLAGRLESRTSEFSEIIFFEKAGEEWRYIENAPKLSLQDPFVTFIDGQLLLGGVQVAEGEDHKLTYKTVFYLGKSIFDLSYAFEGCDFMKDIRLLQLPNKKILVFTRPQGVVGGRGTIGYTILDSLNAWSINKISNATLLQNQFIPEEWGGCNEVHDLGNGVVGVLAHIACFDAQGNRHYYATTFTFNYLTGIPTPMKIIATRNQSTCKESKRPDLVDVVFSGGLIRNKDGTATLYCGVSDCEAHQITIVDPFLI